MSQVFIFSVISRTISDAFTFLTTAATLAYLIPYLVSAIYSLKLVIKGETYDQLKGSRVRDGLIAILACAYSVFVIVTGTADLTTFILGIGLFFVGLIVYPFVNKKFQKKNKHNEKTPDLFCQVSFFIEIQFLLLAIRLLKQLTGKLK